MNVKKHTEILGTVPVGRLTARIAIPSSVALLVTSTYNLVDAIFVGRGVGPDAIGALTLVQAMQIVVMSFGGLIAVGSSSIVSRTLGAGDIRRARRALGNAFSASIIVGLIMTALGQIFLERLLRLLGAEGSLVAPTRDYLRILLFTEPLILINLSSNALMRAEGQAKVAMSTMIVGMLVNIALDPLFIFGFGWGVKGAALATLIGRGCTFALVLVFYAGNRASVRPELVDFKPDRRILLETMKVGISAFVRQVGAGLVTGLRNNLLVAYGGSMFISAFGAVWRLIIFLGMPGMGIAEAVLPIAGYNYGAGNLDRVRKSLWISIGACTLYMCVGFTICQVFPEQLLLFFSNDRMLITEGIAIMRYTAFLFLVFPAYIIAPSFYQALGKSGRALFLSLTRPIAGAVTMVVGVRLFGVMGVVASDPVAVALGALVALIYMRTSLKTLRPPPSSGV